MYLVRHNLVERYHDDGDADPNQTGQSDLLIQQEHCHRRLEGQAPSRVQAGAEVDYAVGVGAHEVDDLSNAELASVRSGHVYGVSVHSRGHRSTDLGADCSYVRFVL